MVFGCRCGWKGDVAIRPELVAYAEKKNEEARERPEPAWMSVVEVLGRVLVVLPFLLGFGVAYLLLRTKGLLLFVGGGFVPGFFLGLILLTLYWFIYWDLRICHHQGVAFRLSVFSHNMAAWLVSTGSALGVLLLGLYLQPGLEPTWNGYWYWCVLLGVLMVTFGVVRWAFRWVVPARCHQCGEAAYFQRMPHHCPLSVDREEPGSWVCEFVCVNCGQVSDTRLG
jgi:hypothetical protein